MPETSQATSAPSDPPPGTPTPAVPEVAVHFDRCPDCRVLATRPAVAGAFSAALVDLGAQGAALVSVTGAGRISSAARILYGSTFPAPAGAVLPCDSGGRCLVVGARADGRAVVSAFQLDTDGTWTDRTPDGGLTSSTAKAQVITLVGEPAVAIQDGTGPAVVWTVYTWVDDAYGLLGCEPGAGTVDVAGLSTAKCLS